MRARWVIGGLVFYALTVGVTIELAARSTYHFRKPHLPFFLAASQFAYRFYPALRQAMQDPSPPMPRVLVLAASTLHPEFGDVASRLQQALEAAWGSPVRVDNLSVPGHGALDSYYKYWYVRQKSFDLVVLYHGINELRANNVPDALWKDDYSHYWWYTEVNFYFTHQPLTRWGLLAPFYLKAVLMQMDHKLLHPHRFVTDGVPRPEWLVYGDAIKTARPFKRDLERIMSLAESKGEPVVLMTFAYALPEGYTLERLRQRTLGFAPAPNASPVELWGTPEHIRKGLEVHNAVIRDLAASHPVVFVDQAALLGQDPKLFIDVSHLSPDGAGQFVEHLISAIQRRGIRPRTTFTRASSADISTVLMPAKLRGLRKRGLRLPRVPMVVPMP